MTGFFSFFSFFFPPSLLSTFPLFSSYFASFCFLFLFVGKVVTVVNRSEIVGRPLSAMMANDGAEVNFFIIHNITTQSVT